MPSRKALRPSSASRATAMPPLSFRPSSSVSSQSAGNIGEGRPSTSRNTASGSQSPISSGRNGPSTSLTLSTLTYDTATPSDTTTAIASTLAAKLNRLHQHWSDAAKLLERKRKKMEALHHKIYRIEKKINRRQAQLVNYEFLVKDYYPQVIEDLKRLAEEEEEKEEDELSEAE